MMRLVAPAGVAWKKARDTYPLIELYNADESHPSLTGTYLVACTFYSTIYHKSCVASSFMPIGIPTADAYYMQTIASNTVLDSLENWQQYGSLPRAGFSSTNIQSQYSFTNQSLRSTQYEWNFGDGSSISTTPSPVHNYTAIGTYTVTLKATNTCGKYDLFSKTISVTSVLTGVGDQNGPASDEVFYANETLTVLNHDQASKIKIYDMKGSLIKEFNLTAATNILQLPPLITGIYLYTLVSEQKESLRGKFAVN
ncbi:xanthomonalisin [Filimonas sp.]|nr:xanthomonalisin [Filimonas sp.]